jgi:hypothetical protein
VTLRLLVYFFCSFSARSRMQIRLATPRQLNKLLPLQRDPGATRSHSLCTRFDPPHLDKIENNRKSSPTPSLTRVN